MLCVCEGIEACRANRPFKSNQCPSPPNTETNPHVHENNRYDELKEFVQAVSDAGVRHLVVHARKCILKGLSPSQNRSVPPLKYPVSTVLPYIPRDE